MTHRVISRNASSSRAIPTAKLIEEVRSDALRAAPVFWGKNQSGMQAARELPNRPKDQVCVKERYIQRNPSFHDPLIFLSEKQAAMELWRGAALRAADSAEQLHKIGAHKQIVNRLLEPFSHINVVATATEWDNFFGLRLHKDAQPEMRALAIAMWEARKASTPKLLRPGEWHLPFITEAEQHEIIELFGSYTIATKISVARCARVSYESFETGKQSTVEEDLKLYERLVGAQPLHASPAEHQATPDDSTNGMDGKWMHENQWGNFTGWRMFRKMLHGEAVAPLPEEYR